jgi:hypothetical protein
MEKGNEVRRALKKLRKTNLVVAKAGLQTVWRRLKENHRNKDFLKHK